MAQRQSSRHSGAADAIEEFESLADRTAHWVAAHAGLSLGVLALILLSAAGYGGYSSWRSGQSDAAADALERTRSAFLEAMGAPPGSLEVPELANPAAAQGIRQEFVGRFEAVAEEHAGTGPAALARLEIGDLERDLGDDAAALAVWQQALQEVPGDSGLRGILQQRIAAVHEDAGRWVEAAKAHEAAGSIRAYPLRAWALGDAIRCYVQAGDSGSALVLADQLEAEGSGSSVPETVRPLLLELRAAAAKP